MKNTSGFLSVIIGFIIYLLPDIAIAQHQEVVVQSPDTYVYNNGKDTIYLAKISGDDFCLCDPVKVTDTIQIDGLGAKEVVLYRNCSCSKEEHGGTFDISEHKAMSKYEVWNVDTKVLLFESVNSFMESYDRFIANTTPGHQKGRSAYKYDFIMDAKGVITIKNGPDDDDSKPDHEEGIYKFVNGKYVKQ